MSTEHSTWWDEEDEQPTSDISLDDLEQWAVRTNSDEVIAWAIIAVAEESEDAERTPTAVWYDPTPEVAKVKEKAREELTYHRRSRYQLSEDGIYLWGDEEIDLGIREDG